MTKEPTGRSLWETSDSRRIELGKRWKDVLAETGLSHETLNRWRKGYKVDSLTDRAFEKALRWDQGARDALAAGRQPNPLDGAAVDSGERRGPTLSQELEVARRVMAETVRALGLSPDEADEAWQLVREDVMRTHRSDRRPEDPSENPRRRHAG